ncbi:MAG: DUF1269 domain-containing protein [Anaerolineae bacterium]
MADKAPQHLVVCLFDGVNQATEAREAIEAVDRKLDVVKLGNIAVIYKDAEGKVSITETGDVKHEWGRWSLGTGTAAAVAVALTGGAILVPALVAGGVAAVATQFIDTGFPDSVLKEIGAGLDGGQSVLITIVDNEQERDIVQTELSGLGGRLIQNTLAEETVRKLGATAAAATAAGPDPGLERAPTEAEALPRAARDTTYVPVITPKADQVVGSPGVAFLAQVGTATPSDLQRWEAPAGEGGVVNPEPAADVEETDRPQIPD